MSTLITCEFCGLVLVDDNDGVEVVIQGKYMYSLCRWCNNYIPLYLELTNKEYFDEMGLEEWLYDIIGFDTICDECNYNRFTIKHNTKQDLFRLRCDTCGKVKSYSLTNFINNHVDYLRY